MVALPLLKDELLYLSGQAIFPWWSSAIEMFASSTECDGFQITRACSSREFCGTRPAINPSAQGELH